MKQKSVKNFFVGFFSVVLLATVFSLVFPLFNTPIAEVPTAQAASISNGDGLLVYGQSANTTPRSNLYSTATNTFAAQAGTIAGSVGQTFAMRTSPLRLEAVAAYVTSAGVLNVMCYDGVTWSSEWTVTVGGSGLAHRFDIAYETSTGDAMLLYSTNTATTNELAYRTKPGTAGCGASNWVAAVNVDPVRTSGTVQYIRMATDPRAGQNLITAIWSDTNSDLGAMVWSGSAWGNEPGAVLETNLNIIAAASDVESFDIVDESLTGQTMVVWSAEGTGAAGLIKYSRCTGGTSSCTWSAAAAIPTVADSGANLDISVNPASNEVVVGAIDDGSSDLSIAYWSGSAWTGKANVDTTTATPVAGTKLVATGWLTSGATTRSVVVYNDAAATNIGWYVGTAGAFAAQVDFTPTPAFGNPQKWYNIQMDPFNSDRFLLIATDTNNDLFAKRLVMTGVPAFTWTNADGGAALEPNLTQAIVRPFAFTYWRSTKGAVSVGNTAGSQISLRNSGDTSQLANDTACTSAATCAAFTVSLSNATDTLSSIKITTSGTVNANSDLSNLALFYDTDGNYSNGTTGQFGSTVGSFSSGTATVNGSLAISANTTYYFYVRFDVKSTTPTYPKGGQTVGFSIAANTDVVTSGAALVSGASTALTGVTTIAPNATGTTFGSGLADGGRSSESITISGFGFGVATAGANRSNCAGAVDTGCVRFAVGGSATVGNADVTAWSNTSITFTINTGLASTGGASALEVVAGSQSDQSDLTFYVYPRITGMTTCAAGGARDNVCGTNSAEEYAAGDTFGLVQLNGDHFKATAGTLQFTGSFGSVAGTVHNVVEGPCAVSGWADTSVCLEVSTSISDTVHDGTITMTRNGDSKTHTIALHVLPRILTNTLSSDIIGDVVVLDGNHFCQTGTCPGSPPTGDYKVYFGSTQAISSDFVATGSCLVQAASWSNTRICVKVPSGTPSGSADTKVQGQASPLYESQRKTFTVLSTTPNSPNVGPGTNKGQYKSDGTTVISIGGYIASGTAVFKADLSAAVTIPMALQVEVEPVGTAFVCSSGSCASAVEGTIGGGGACASCSSLAGATLTISGLVDSSKHWQARARNTVTDEYSAWVSFGGNAESAADFIVDTAAPVVTFPAGDTCSDAVSSVGANGATISWSLNESGDGQVQYSTDSGLSGSTSYPTPADASSSSHAITLSNLNSNTTYYFRVKSNDAAGNLGQRPTGSPFCSFSTQTVTQPGKTTVFYIVGQTSSVTNNSGNGSTFTFSVPMPETGVSIKSSFVEITGISNSGGTNSVQVTVNGQSANTYAIDASGKTAFKVLYPVDSSTLDINDAAPCTYGIPGGTPPCNQLKIVPTAGLDISITSAKIVTTYGFTP